jgi:DNA invertase Pin-like site-specific DNA recombinase
MFQIIGAMAEFERSLIQERVRAGLRNAVARGVPLGRPRTVVDAVEIARLRGSGASWREVAEQLHIGIGTAVRALQQSVQKPSEIAPPDPSSNRPAGG